LFPSIWQDPGPRYGVPQGMEINVAIDDKIEKSIEIRTSSLEILVANRLKPGNHQIVIRPKSPRDSFIAIKGFRTGDFSFGSISFQVFGEEGYFFNNIRVQVKQNRKIVLNKIARNSISGECLITGLKTGRYDINLRAFGWKTLKVKGVDVWEGKETKIGSLFLRRKERAMSIGICGVIRPGRGKTVFVRPGEEFNIFFRGKGAEGKINDNDADIIESAALFTDYLHIPLKIVDVKVNRELYTYEHLARVKIPRSLPEDLYDLVVGLKHGQAFSPQAVRIYKTFPRNFYIVTFGHTNTWDQETAEYLHRKAEMINLINPEFVLISNEVNWAYISGALMNLRVPYFITAGNHSYPDFEAFYGAKISMFDYGPIRGVNFGMPWSCDWNQVKRAFLDRPEATFRILNTYEWNAPVKGLLDLCKINLMHDAHGRGGKKTVESVGKTPTLCVGKVNSDSFRLVRIEKNKVISAAYNGGEEAPSPFSRGSDSPLRIKFSPANNGRHKRVKATIINNFKESFKNARVRFIMPGGRYKVNGGLIFQQFHSNNKRLTIVDVKVAIGPSSKGIIYIFPLQGHKD